MGPMFCSPDGFWLRMCSPGFIRTSLHTGRDGVLRFWCETAPEEIPGFVAERMRKTMVAIGASEYEMRCFVAAVSGLAPPPKPWHLRAIEWLRPTQK